jgi:hypothetical protein
MAATVVIFMSTHFDNAPGTTAAASQDAHGHFALDRAFSSGAGSIPVDTMPIAVDGSKTPERIPDYLAYYHFIMAAAERENAPKDKIERRDSMIERIGLTEIDYVALLSALDGVRHELDQISSERERLAASPLRSAFFYTSLDQLKVRERGVMDQARTRLSRSLTWDGWHRLDTHVREHVKRHIVVYGTAPADEDR